MLRSFTGLWRSPDFLKLWAAITVSLAGSQVTALGLPLLAALVLEATPVQMGLLIGLERAPALLFGLFVGVWVDRLSRRPMLVVADLGRALLLASIPVVGLLGLLRMEQLYCVAFLCGLLTVLFDVAHQSFLPTLVPRERLAEGNGKLSLSRSFADSAGPGLAGALVQLLSAPIALVVDVLSFLVSALCIGMVRSPEPAPPARSQRGSLRGEIGEGVRVLLGDPILRALAGGAATQNFSTAVIMTVYVLFATRELGFSAPVIGAVFTVLGVSALLGSLVAPRATRRFGLGATVVGASIMVGVANLFIPLAGGPMLLGLGLLVAAHLLKGLAMPSLGIASMTLRQAVTPHRLHGRVNAGSRVITVGAVGLGALAGGFLGEAIGLRPTLAIGALAALGVPVWMLLSPVRSLGEAPEPPTTGAGAPVPQPA